ncbi:hypothetical protein N665_0084s0002 [Sinapis alba]|nr:hypothetical protein N665_0084s0002 [Sinapis alba]
MDLALTKCIFEHGHEPQVDKINNIFKTSFLKTLDSLFPEEYAEVNSDPLFTHIMALNDSSMGYSTRLIHSFMYKQLFTAKKHELWFEFAGQSLRFSLQEFQAVTSLKSSKETNCDFEKRRKISLKSIRLQHLQQCHKWSHVDRIMLIYLTVIASVLMAKDEKISIYHKYIKLVMDIEKLKKLENKTSYVLDGFTYAFQIWIMEAIPDFGEMLGKKKDKEFVGPRCGNWRGATKISYKHNIQLEPLLGSHCTLYTCISASNYEEVLLTVALLRDDELNDERVDHMLELITKHHKWSTSMWGFDESVVNFLEEDVDIDTELSDENISDGIDAVKTTPTGGESSVSGSKRVRSKVVDHGAKIRKMKLLCTRAA